MTAIDKIAVFIYYLISTIYADLNKKNYKNDKKII